MSRQAFNGAARRRDKFTSDTYYGYDAEALDAEIVTEHPTRRVKIDTLETDALVSSTYRAA